MRGLRQFVDRAVEGWPRDPEPCDGAALSLGAPAAADRLERAIATGLRRRDIMQEGGIPLATRGMGDAVLMAAARLAPPERPALTHRAMTPYIHTV